MDKKELLKKIKKIEFKASKLSDNIFSGQYKSKLKGNGLEFSDIRRYSFGDDIRNIDWKVTAKQGKAYVKEFTEERELSIFLLIDISKSMLFKEKLEYISEIVASLAFSATKTGDKVGAIFFTDEIERVIPLKKGKKHAMAILDTLLNLKPKGDKTDIAKVLRYCGKIYKRRATIFVLSDFLDENFENELRLLSKKQELIPVRIGDKRSEELPTGAIFTLCDSETGETIVIENFSKNPIKTETFNLKKGINLYYGEDYVKEITRFFKKGR